MVGSQILEEADIVLVFFYKFEHPANHFWQIWLNEPVPVPFPIQRPINTNSSNRLGISRHSTLHFEVTTYRALSESFHDNLRVILQNRYY